MSPLLVYPGQEELARAAADLFVARGLDALHARGRFRVALSGGRGPRGLFNALAGRPGALDWGKVELFWVDERWVPPSDAESNFGETRRLWLDRVNPGPTCFPMFDSALTPELAAERYALVLSKRFKATVPMFDLVLLGMGPDGHTASLFPGQDSLNETLRLCLAVRHPTTGQDRLTLTYPVLNAARSRVFLLEGAEKAALLAEVLAGRSTVPAARVAKAPGELLWLADAAAASRAT